MLQFTTPDRTPGDLRGNAENQVRFSARAAFHSPLLLEAMPTRFFLC